MEDFKKEIEEIKIDCSEPNWDGYDANPISLESIDYIIEFAEKLPSNLLKNAGDIVCPEPSGMLGMEWVVNKDGMSVSIDWKGVLYFVSMIGKNTMMIEYDFGKKGMRKDILDMIINFNK